MAATELMWRRCAGYVLGILNTCDHAVAMDLHATENIGIPLMVSAGLGGAAVGAFFAGQLADKLGPRTALLYNNAFFAGGYLLSGLTPAGFWGMLLGACPATDACTASYAVI